MSVHSTHSVCEFCLHQEVSSNTPEYFLSLGLRDHQDLLAGALTHFPCSEICMTRRNINL